MFYHGDGKSGFRDVIQKIHNPEPTKNHNLGPHLKKNLLSINRKKEKDNEQIYDDGHL